MLAEIVPRGGEGGVSVEGCDDDVDAGGVPPLDGFVVGAEKAGKAAPGEEVAVGEGANEGAAADDAAQDDLVVWDEGDPGEGLVHAGDSPGGGRGEPGPAGFFGGEGLDGFGDEGVAGLAQGGGVSLGGEAEEGLAGFFEAVDDGFGVDVPGLGAGG